MSGMAPREVALEDVQRACRGCRRCVEAGLIPTARPVFSGTAQARILLVGQAPGQVENVSGKPFSGRSGRVLSRWMAAAGFASEAEFRELVYIAAVMRCFPGKAASGGDRRPPPAALENCRGWLEAELALIRPRLVVAVGQLAIGRMLGSGPLEARVGRVFPGPPPVLPLPHPSGQSRWLNGAANRERLEQALAHLREWRERVLA